MFTETLSDRPLALKGLRHAYHALHIPPVFVFDWYLHVCGLIILLLHDHWSATSIPIFCLVHLVTAVLIFQF